MMNFKMCRKKKIIWQGAHFFSHTFIFHILFLYGQGIFLIHFNVWNDTFKLNSLFQCYDLFIFKSNVKLKFMIEMPSNHIILITKRISFSSHILLEIETPVFLCHTTATLGCPWWIFLILSTVARHTTLSKPLGSSFFDNIWQ